MPVSTDQVAAAVLSAAEAGAAIAHIHVRDPETGQGSRDVDLFAAVVEKVRASDTDVIINLTAGMGGSWFPSEDGDPSMPGPGTDMIGPQERLAHVDKLRPDICSLDCGTMNFGENGPSSSETIDYTRAKTVWLNTSPDTIDDPFRMQ